MDNGDVAGIIAVLVLIGIGIGIIAFTMYVWWRIISRTGYSGWLSLLIWIPLANFILLLVLAFGEWPIQREIADLRRRLPAG